MAKSKKQHQQASKKKLQVKQSQKQTKVESAAANPKGKSQGSEGPDSLKVSQGAAASQQQNPAEPAGSENAVVYGLNNLGNTCFYNSAVQALVSVPAVREFCTQPQPGRQLQKGPLGAALQELVQTVYGLREVDQAHSTKASKQSRREATPLFCPSRLRGAVIKIAPQFKGQQQQDSHELFRCLIDGLLSEEHRAISYLKEHNEDAPVPPSFTEELFGGELSSRVVCKECSHETVNLEPFYDLSLPIPASLPALSKAEANAKPKGKGPKNKGKASIEKPDESPAAQEQQKLTAKQRKKAEKEERRKVHIARKKQRKRGSDSQNEELPLPESTPSASEQPPTSAAAAGASSPSSGSSSSDATHAPADEATSSGPAQPVAADSSAPPSSPFAAAADTAHAAVEQEATREVPADGEQKLCGGMADDSSAREAADAVELTQPSSSRRSAQTTELRLPSNESKLPRSAAETGTEVLPESAEASRADFASSADSPSRDGQGALAAARTEAPATTSVTYTSRNAESLSMLAAAQTGFRAGTAPAASHSSCDGQRGLGIGAQLREPQQTSEGGMTRLSEHLQSASLAPDAKSGNHRATLTPPPADLQAAAGNPSKDAATVLADAADSTCLGEQQVPPVRAENPTGEESDETNPPGAELAGGTGAEEVSKPDKAAECTHIEASTVVDVLLQPSAVFRATADAHDFAHDAPQSGSSAGLIAVPVLPTPEPRLSGSGLPPEAFPLEQPSSASAESDHGKVPDDEAEELSVSLPAGENSAEVEQQLGVGLTSEEEAALYGDLDVLQEDLGGLGDLSDTDADVSAADQQPPGLSGTCEVSNEPEEEGEEMGALGSMFDVDDSADTAGADVAESLGWDQGTQQQEATQEANIQGCLAAFFAREVIEWECPAESAAASKQRSDEQALASASIDGTPQPLKRRSVSFSEEAPRVKFIPGSAEQRGTNFVRALQGDRPFCRPLKYKGGSFLLNAYVDNVTKDKLHLGLQGQDENDATQLPLRDVHAINNRIEFGSVPISPVEDPEDEEEQSRVRSQAQALLDCVADLVHHSGLQGAINLLTEGAQLQRVPSGAASLGSLNSPRSGSDMFSRAGSDCWRIIGSLPPGFGEGAWEYPPPRDDSQGLSPSFRSPSTDVYVPTDPSDKARPPSKLPASFWARFAASQEPIMEAAREGSIGDTDSQPSGELPAAPLTPHNSLNEDAAASQAQCSDAGPGGIAPGQPPSGDGSSGGGGAAAAGRRQKKKKPAPPVLDTRNSFTINAEVPVSPFSNDPEGRLLSNGWEPSWPVQLPAGQRDSSEAYCRIFCSDKGRKSARPLSLSSDPIPAAAASSPFGRRASSGGYFADSEDDDAASGSHRGMKSQASSSTGFGGSSPFASGPSFPDMRDSGRSPFGDPEEDADTASSGNGFGRRLSDRAPFADPEPGDDTGGVGLFARRDSQMGFPGLDEEFSNRDTSELPSASPSLSSPFSGRSAAPSPFAAPDLQSMGDASSSGEAPVSVSPFAAQKRSSSSNGDSAAQNGRADQPRGLPNGVHMNGLAAAAANGGDAERQGSGRGRADSASTPPTGVNKATGNAVFWAGSKSLGISFVDDPGDAAPEPSGMRLPGGAETAVADASDRPAHETDEPELPEVPAERDVAAPPGGGQPRTEAARAKDASADGHSSSSPAQPLQGLAAKSAAGTGKSAVSEAPGGGLGEGAGVGETSTPGAEEEEASLVVERKAQSLPTPQRTPGLLPRSGRALQRSASKSILRRSNAVSIKREAVKGYLVHRAPEVLMLHLKRFEQDMRGRLRKIHGGVPFPGDLDLTPFCDPKGKDAAGAQYTLVGVVEHQGSMVSGHYWAYVARPPPDGHPPPPQPQGPPAQSPRQQSPKQPRTERQDSFNSDDAVPLAPVHKSSSSAKSGAAAITGTAAKSGSQAAAKTGAPSTAAADNCTDSEPAKGDGNSSGGAAARQLPAGFRPKLDSAKLQWFQASDEKVKRVSWDTVAACDAYILMYVRVR